MTEQIEGLTLHDCARINAKHTELRAQHGERDMGPHLRAFLSEQGVDETTWARAWNAWWARMESDPTGKLHARFASLQQEHVLQAHMGDVPDASQDERSGVSLERYAQVMALIAAGGDAEAILAEHGLPMAQWLAAQEGWNAAMATDIGLTTQYGLLYAKHSPGFQERMEAQVAAVMAAEHARRQAGDDDTEEEVEHTLEDFVRELVHSDADTRWRAAHHVFNAWDIGDRDDATLDQAVRRAHQLALECLADHDDTTVSNAEALARDLAMLGTEGFLTAEQAGAARDAIGRCLGSARAHLEEQQAAFAPIRDKRVPERVHLQSAIQDTESLIETLADLHEDWNPSLDATPAPAPSASAPSAPSKPARVASAPVVAPGKPDHPLLVLLRGLPVIGDILRALGL